MNSEDCSVTENSSSHLETRQKDNVTRIYFEKHHEGSIQVPIPCAVLNVCFITTLIIALVAINVGQYNCPGKYKSMMSPDGHVAACSDEWIGYHKRCYLFSTTANSWDLAQNSCSKDGATLAVIDSKKDKNFLQRYAGGVKHWIGLKNEAGQTWRWSDGKEFNKWFNMTGLGNCAFLTNMDVNSTACEKHFHWICSKPSR